MLVAVVAALVTCKTLLFDQTRGGVDGAIAAAAEPIAGGMPDLGYHLLYEDGSDEAKCYEALAGDFAAGLSPASSNPLSWPMLPIQSQGRERDLASVAASVMFDDPALTAYTSGEVSMAFVGSRYLVESDPVREHEDFATMYADTREQGAAIGDTVSLIAEGDDRAYVLAAYRMLSEDLSYLPQEEADDVDHPNDAYGALVGRRSQCVGLASAMKLVLDAGGIPNYVAYGNVLSTDEGHAWNMLWLDDSWYVCDLTSGCRSILNELAEGTEARETLDSNLAAVTALMPNCLARPSKYGERVRFDETSELLMRRYEELFAEYRKTHPKPAPLPEPTLEAAVMEEEEEVVEVPAGDETRVPVIERPPVGSLKYSSLMDDAQLSFYAAVHEDLLTGRIIDPDNSDTWFVSPVSIATDEECEQLTRTAEKVLYDDPILSVTNGGGGWTMRYYGWAYVDNKGQEHGSVSRYAIVSDISLNDAEVISKMDLTRVRAAEVAQRAWGEGGGDLANFVHAAYRDISIACAYSDDIDDSMHHNDAYGALVEGEAKCYGVSCAMKMVLDAAGIPNYVAFGEMNGTGHAWNVLWFDGEWKACDLTTGSLFSTQEYAEGTVARNVLMSGIDRLDPYYQMCLAPVDEYYALSGATPDETCLRLQADYEATHPVQ